jgi:hypothetical protein
MTPPDARPLVLAEVDYCYGTGQITLRVERIDRANPVRYDGENFYLVTGVQLTPSGAELGRREVLVRGRRLP